MEPVRFETMAAEYSRAFRSARTAKNLLVLFILLALLVQIGGFVLVHFVGALNPLTEPAFAVPAAAGQPASGSATTNPTWHPTHVAAPFVVGTSTTPAFPLSAATQPANRLSDEQTKILRAVTDPYEAADPSAHASATATSASELLPATQPAGTTAAEPARKPFLSLGASEWDTIINWAMSASKFVAMISSVLLVFTLLLTMDLSLLGRLGGAAGFVSAFFWSLLLLVMLIPWHEVIHMSLACGATHNLGELQADIQNIQGISTKTFSWALAAFYCRFLAYPGIALAILLLVQGKFAKGYRQMTASTTTA